jgi:pimeloyl-ACP methyl ester carboxylesterase
MSTRRRHDTTVVLVHAAWADASSWSKVIPQLQRQGFDVVSAQIPLTSLTDDVAAVQRVLGRVDGPVVLAAHSYGGAVITAAASGQPKVKALVFVAAIVPDEGETVGQLFYRVAPHPEAPKLAPDEHGLIWMSEEGFANAVAPEASSEEIALMSATQKPIALKCLGEPTTKPAWKEKPSWYLLAENDRMISPATQRFMAERMKARIDSQPVDHTPLISAPESVVRLITEAATFLPA